MEPKCVLFDFDGVIADTETSNADYLARALNVYGIPLTEKDRLKLIGRNTTEVLPGLLDRAAVPVTPEEILEVRKKQGNTYENSPRLKTMPGLCDFLYLLRKKQCKTGLVTSTSAHLILAALNRLELTSSFDVIICGDMVQNRKPEPEGYQKAMHMLSVEPADCVIIEDSPIGIRAGLRAGATVIGYTGASIKQDITKAHFTVESFSDCARLPMFNS